MEDYALPSLTRTSNLLWNGVISNTQVTASLSGAPSLCWIAGSTSSGIEIQILDPGMRSVG